MSITVTLAGTDRTSWIDQDGLRVQQLLGVQRNSATLIYKKFGSRSYSPAVLDTVLIQDGSTSIFGGRIATIEQVNINNADGVTYKLDCVDYVIDLDSKLVSQTYTSQTIAAIIADFATNFSTGFTTTNVICTFVVDKIVFNQVPISQAIKKLADLVQYNWYVDPAKDIHFFPKYTELAPFSLTDTSGNYVNSSLKTTRDGTQLANTVKVRGAQYLGTLYSDSITVKGSISKSFKLPYQFSTLTITVNAVSKTVGADFLDTFSTYDTLYNFQQWTVFFPSALADGDVIAYTGYPYIPVLAIASDAASITSYGTREKIIEDSSITDINVARRRAVAELTAYKDPLQNARFDTYTSGLHVGQVINVNSSRRVVNTDYLIRAVTFSMHTPTSFVYTVELVTIKMFSLIEVLQSLLQPVALPIDPNEATEIIKTDLVTVTVGEVIAYDPLGAHVAPSWVLGAWIPSGTTDTKRVICIDRVSAVLL